MTTSLSRAVKNNEYKEKSGVTNRNLKKGRSLSAMHDENERIGRSNSLASDINSSGSNILESLHSQ